MLIFINTAKPDDKWIRFVPPTLLADCAVLKIPSQALTVGRNLFLSVFEVMEAYHFKNTHKKMPLGSLDQLSGWAARMWESKAVIVPIKEVKSSLAPAQIFRV